MADLQAISEALQKGKANDVKEMVQAAIDEGVTARKILEEGMMAGMDVVGAKFKNNEIYVPEVLIAARAMNAGISILRPLLVDEDVKPVGTVVIGTVKGDLHDIGKNLVKMMMEGKGLNVVDLGSDVAAEAFVAAAQENEADIICCSALLTTTMTEMKNVIAAVESAGIRDKVKVMVGGAPVTEQFCESIGADAYTPDAASAAEKALELVKA
jgi:corrinoid protein of di/trimethylamine methyltransferase